MSLPNFFNQQDTQNILDRLNSLTEESQAQWGKMSVDQMFAHCAEVLKVATGQIHPKRMLAGYIIGPLLKYKFTEDKPFHKSSPTHPSFKISDKRDFIMERKQLMDLIVQFSEGGPHKVSKQPHVFFGKLTPEQWARGLYKHLDHHLKQFGV